MKTSLIAFLTHFLSRFSTPPFLYLPFYPSLFIPPLISAHSLPLSVYLTANTIPSHLTMYLSVHTVNPFVCPSLSSFLHPSIHPCIHPSIHSVSLFIHLHIYSSYTWSTPSSIIARKVAAFKIQFKTTNRPSFLFLGWLVINTGQLQ